VKISINLRGREWDNPQGGDQIISIFYSGVENRESYRRKQGLLDTTSSTNGLLLNLAD